MAGLKLLVRVPDQFAEQCLLLVEGVTPQLEPFAQQIQALVHCIQGLAFLAYCLQQKIERNTRCSTLLFYLRRLNAVAGPSPASPASATESFTRSVDALMISNDQTAPTARDV